jgi:PKD repeat protein
MKPWGRWVFLSVVLLFAGRAWCGEVVFNEVAWAGTSSDGRAEWIELFNLTDHAIPLEGWRLVSSDGCPEIDLIGTIPPLGFYLLERGDDDVLPGVDANLIYQGALNDGGETLCLIDSGGVIVDTANGVGGGWPAGTNRYGSPPCCSMERIDPTAPDTPSNWATFRIPAGKIGKGGQCGSPKAKNSVFNISPCVVFSISPLLAHLGEAILFDAGASFDPDGNIASFLWWFGDGTFGEGKMVSHAYIEVGEYRVLLKVTDNGGWVVEREQILRVVDNTPPVVDFSVKSVSSGQVLRSLDELVFLDESFNQDGQTVAWCWQFGDGGGAEGETVSYVYQRPGGYVVALCVMDDQGETACQTQSVRIENRAPTALFTSSPASPNVGTVVSLDASASFDPDGDVLSYEWDFGADGVIDLVSDQTTVKHVFSAEGDQTVILQVRDDTGAISPPCEGTVHINASPIAVFQVSDFSPDEGETVAFTDCSYDLDSEIVAWEWDFGDAVSSDRSSPEHIYLDDGVYDVTLTVMDEQGAKGATKARITVQNLLPVSVLEVEGEKEGVERLTGISIVFDATKSLDPSPEGRILRYEWDLEGLGTYAKTTEAGTLTYSYSDDGTYQVRVRVVDDDEGVALSNPITVQVRNRPPSCTFKWSPQQPNDAESVRFSDTSVDADGEVTSWQWEFGDGETSTDALPEHQFRDDGTYTVTLVVRDDDGAEASYSGEIAVMNASPVAAFTVAPAALHCGGVVKFTSLSEDPSPAGQIIHIAWDFGDGTSCPGLPTSCGGGDLFAPTHIYQLTGQYRVRLVVIDEQGALGWVSQMVVVEE